MSFDHPYVLLLILPLGAFLIGVWHFGYLGLSRARRVVSLATRLVLVALIVVGLSGPHLVLAQSRQAVVFVADLSASDARDAGAMQNLINQAASRRPTNGVLGVVSTGRQAVVEQPVGPLASFDGFQSALDPNYTNLESGLELAGALLPDGYRKRVVLLSDGQENVGDAVGAARVLQAEGARVDVIPVKTRSGPDVRIDSVAVPEHLQPNEKFSVVVTLFSTVRTRAQLDIFRDRSLTVDRTVAVSAGSNRYSFGQSPLRSGFHTFAVHIAPAVDSQNADNSGSAFTVVGGAPRVLVVAWIPREADNVVRSLRASGMSVDQVTPGRVDSTLQSLQRYAAVVVVDTPAPILGSAFLSQLVPYVRDLGRGLVVLGGEGSYSLGAYGQTPLEKVLPVRMELPRRKDLPSAAVVLIIESLEETLPINISKAAGKEVVKLLTEEDQVAINDTPDTGSGWVVPLQHPRNKLAIDLAMDAMNPGDPHSYVPALLASGRALTQAHARIKHIIILGDGDAYDNRYASVAKKLRAEGITVSTVITNGGGPDDFRTMRDLARWGGGRYYRADNPQTIPRIFLREARTVARSGITTGTFYPERLSSNPMIRHLGRIPPLDGYVTTAAKPAAEVVLASRKLDPVLAAWQFGLGRSVAWTSDTAGLWTRHWLASPEVRRFWTDVVEWTLPSSDAGNLFVTTSVANGQAQVSVDTPASLGTDPEVTAHVVAPRLNGFSIHLQPTLPGRYRGAFAAPSQGAYLITVAARGAGHAAVGQAGIDVPYSVEYSTSGTNMSTLQNIARAGDGGIANGADTAWRNNLSPVYDEQSLTELFWFLAALLLPIDIAARRLLLRRRDLSALERRLGAWGERVGRVSSAPRAITVPRARSRTAATVLTGPTGPRAQSGRSSARPAAAEAKTQPAGPRHARTEPKGQRATSGQATVSQLLAAKRRKE